MAPMDGITSNSTDDTMSSTDGTPHHTKAASASRGISAARNENRSASNDNTMDGENQRAGSSSATISAHGDGSVPSHLASGRVHSASINGHATVSEASCTPMSDNSHSSSSSIHASSSDDSHHDSSAMHAASS